MPIRVKTFLHVGPSEELIPVDAVSDAVAEEHNVLLRVGVAPVQIRLKRIQARPVSTVPFRLPFGARQREDE